MLKDHRVLVTGGTGFIGTNLVQRLVDMGAVVRATYHSKSPTQADNRVEYFQADLRKPQDCLRAADGMQHVVMCAANSSGAAVMQRTPLVHLTPNVVMNVQMLEAAYTAEVEKFLFISSSTVYPLTDTAVQESDVTNEFFDKYHIVGWMKRFSEIVCDIYATRIARPMPVVVVRPGNLYGPFDKFTWEESKVIPALIRRALERHDPIEVWGDGMDLKDFLYIDDFIDGLLLALEKSGAYGVYNVASGTGVTIRDVLAEILHVASYEEANVVYDASKPTMIPRRMIDVSRARDDLGFEARMSLQDGLRCTMNWYQDFYRFSSPEGQGAK